MDKKTRQSSIKAFVRELMKEMSVSGNAGGYLTKKAGRKLKKQDITSPTGFESSPNPNMYTKTMKFKIVKPSARLNSKDLWENIIKCSCGWSWDLKDGGDDPYTCHKCGKINTINESKYTQFKKSTTKRSPKEILHKAIKEIQFKLDEVNRLIDFTSRIKGELTEGDQEIEYLKRTKNSLYKIQDKLKEVSNKITNINDSTSTI